MDALLFADRPGASLRPLTSRTAAALLPVAGKPLVVHALEGLAGFAYVLLDCQPTLGVLPVNAMVAAHHFLIPMQPSGYAVRGLGDLREALHSIRRFMPPWDYR
ncbi:MAG: ParA family protein, partial [Spirochaetota bacterium]